VNGLDRRRIRLRRIAVLGILAAVVDGTVGAALLAAAWMLSAGLGHALTIVGSALLFSVIPLLMGAAHLLDRAEETVAAPSPARVVRIREAYQFRER